MDDQFIYTEIFMQADKNKDGFLTFEELYEQMKKFGYKDEELKFKDHLEKFSQRDDKKLTKNEFLEAMHKAPHILHEAAELRRRFYQLDLNKDGMLDKKEMEKVLGCLGERVTVVELDLLMKKFDKRFRNNRSMKKMKI
ncbi:hypothetical protein HELRODRAFT_189136 [Helobdella robusta]|uniref:EF-hand domain-containing protein n=1 Tax=Helobdella robusta TaxID=6412 RepID=T1FQP9_HELRO|nr:hypothetical protein HELRODRAFT_189136 [Helobdella robusta]ESN96165.1 hypothetical protein HELRODRAFT_189136 [Helobdella robusta]